MNQKDLFMVTPNLKLLDTKAKKTTHTSVDTIRITPELVGAWKNPPFQRPLRVNDKVRLLAEHIKQDGGVLPGVITLGVMNKEEYLLDGQHRREAFLLSGCVEGFTDVRKHFFETMAEMGEEFVNLNSSLVKLRPDDILRGLEGSIEGLSLIRKKCPFVGYDMIRRSEKAPLLSMATLLRCWVGSSHETPTASGSSAAATANSLTVEEAKRCVDFLELAITAWGRDPEYVRLWGALNLAICMWLYRRLVLTEKVPTSKVVKLSKEEFQQCLMQLSASNTYIAWLFGRNKSERDRSPAYNRIKDLFVKRLMETGGYAKRPILPQPAWASHSGR